MVHHPERLEPYRSSTVGRELDARPETAERSPLFPSEGFS